MLEFLFHNRYELLEMIYLNDSYHAQHGSSFSPIKKRIRLHNFRGDTVERSRKEVEHRVMSYEEAIEQMEAKLREAAFLTDEATRKREEAAYKAERLQVQI